MSEKQINDCDIKSRKKIFEEKYYKQLQTLEK